MDEHDKNPLTREALHWFAVLRDDEASSDDRAAFEEWRNRSADHEAAWQRAEALWSAFSPVEAEIRQARRRKLGRRAFMASGVAALAAGPAAYWLRQAGAFADFRTGPGERRSFSLADGSTVELGGRSAASQDYTSASRGLTLHRGEAYFTVVDDPGRPFVVTAGGGETTALGTRFNIHLAEDYVTVTVAEHSVEVALAGRAPQELAQGWQLSYSGGELGTAIEADLSVVEAWRRGRLIYHGAPLWRVLDDIERHRGGIILLMSGRLGTVPVSAAFDTASADAALDTIAGMLPLRVVRAGGIVFLYEA